MHRLLLLLPLLVAAPVLASDGALEINQTCAVLTGCFAGDSAGFPVTITSSGTYRFTGDLDVRGEPTPESVTAIDLFTLLDGNVTIDLDGFSIRGPAICSGAPATCSVTGPGIGIRGYLSSSNVIRIRNGTIRGMGNTAVWLSGTGAVQDLLVVRNGLMGIRTQGTFKVIGNVARGNGFSGLFIGSGGSNSVIGNTSFENGQIGILASAAVVKDNTVKKNGQQGIQCFGCTIRGNSVIENVGNGIETDAGSVVIGNAVRENGGIGIFAGSGSSISDNSVHLNSGDGIQAGGGSIVSRNTANENVGAGIVGIGIGSSYFDNTVRSNGLVGIDATDAGLSQVQGNTAVDNVGFGLDLNDPARGDAMYRENVVDANQGGTVNGGNPRDNNTCRGLTPDITSCP